MEKERPLPEPPSRKKPFEGGKQDGSLLSEEMAIAMAEGRIEEFLEEKFPGNEYQKALAQMAAGMSGFAPVGPIAENIKEKTPEGPKTPSVPPELLEAASSGDMEKIMDLLEKEHGKRTGAEEHIMGMGPERKPEPETGKAEPPAMIEKELVDELVRIGKENNLSPDWLVLRALKLYIEEYRKTSRL